MNEFLFSKIEMTNGGLGEFGFPSASCKAGIVFIDCMLILNIVSCSVSELLCSHGICCLDDRNRSNLLGDMLPYMFIHSCCNSEQASAELFEVHVI